MSREWLDSLVVALFCFVVACVFGFFLVLFGLLGGCTPTVEHQVTAPQLDTLSATMKKIVIEDCQKPVLAMPPVPQDCTLDIRPDSAVGSSKDCEDLLRFYVRARQLLKPVAPSAANPAAQ